MKYYVVDFMKFNNIILFGDYSDSEQTEYLLEFKDMSFRYNDQVKCLGVELLMPSSGRVANVRLLNQTAEEIMSCKRHGLSKNEPIGLLQFTLWDYGKREIGVIYHSEKFGNVMPEIPIQAAGHLVASYVQYFLNRGNEGDDTKYAGGIYNMLCEACDSLVSIGVRKNDPLFISHGKILNTLNHFLYVLDDPLNNWETVLERHGLSSQKTIGNISIELAIEATDQFIEYWLGKDECAQYANAVNAMLCEMRDYFFKAGREEKDSTFINYALIITALVNLLYEKEERDLQYQWNLLLEKNGLSPDESVLSKS